MLNMRLAGIIFFPNIISVLLHENFSWNCPFKIIVLESNVHTLVFFSPPAATAVGSVVQSMRPGAAAVPAVSTEPTAWQHLLSLGPAVLSAPQIKPALATWAHTTISTGYWGRPTSKACRTEDSPGTGDFFSGTFLFPVVHENDDTLALLKAWTHSPENRVKIQD